MKKLLAVGVALALTATGSLVEKGWATSLQSDTEDHSITILVEEVAVLGIVGSDPSFVVGAPTKGGDAFVVTSTNADTQYLQYSSIVNPTKERKITAKITLGTLPEGVTLQISPETATGGKMGEVGTAVGTISLNSISQNIVTGIKSGYTGIETTDGVKLNYGLALAPGSLSTTGATNVTVTYTLTEEI
ncbi:MAG: hypothetical protein R6W66_05670 [Pelovirga sp.]